MIATALHGSTVDESLVHVKGHSHTLAKSGVAQLTMSRIELGRHDVGFATVQKILTAMGYELPDLVTESA